jgi:hypothetical protein
VPRFLLRRTAKSPGEQRPTLRELGGFRTGRGTAAHCRAVAWAESDPPPADSTVRLDVLPTIHDSAEAEVELRVQLSNAVPLDFVALLLEIEGVDARPVHPFVGDWRAANRDLERPNLRTITEYYLLSGGLK